MNKENICLLFRYKHFKLCTQRQNTGYTFNDALLSLGDSLGHGEDVLEVLPGRQQLAVPVNTVSSIARW